MSRAVHCLATSSVWQVRVTCIIALQHYQLFCPLYHSFVSCAVLPRSVISSSWWSMVHTMRFNVIIREMKFLNYNELLMVAPRVGSWTHYSPVNVNDLVMDMSFGLSCTDILFFLWLGLIMSTCFILYSDVFIVSLKNTSVLEIILCWIPIVLFGKVLVIIK